MKKHIAACLAALVLCCSAMAQVVVGGGTVGPSLFGGSSAATLVVGLPEVAPPAPVAWPSAITTGLTVSKAKPTVTDGDAGGITIRRDTTTLKGGTRGYVNAAASIYSLVGADNAAFEWAVLGVLQNHARAGENVAGYFQGNKYGEGATWGIVAEAWSNTTDPGALVGQELDVWATGPDTGNRVGLDVVLGDALTTHGGMVPSTHVGGSVGVRIGAGLPSYLWTRGMQLTGNYVVGVDLSTANARTAVRLGYGQEIALEGSDQIKVKFEGGRIKFMNGLLEVLAIDMSTGDVYQLGKKKP
jgi:hypothetical protein